VTHLQPALHTPGLPQDRVNEIERQDLGQLAQVAGSEMAPGHHDFA
jgi:hypothetical protein